MDGTWEGQEQSRSTQRMEDLTVYVQPIPCLSTTANDIAQPPFPQHLLLRDALYLLQGIDGRYVRFAIRPAQQQNPYLTDKGKRGDGMGFPLGKEGEPLPLDQDVEEEIVGLDFVADEQVVSRHFG